MTPYQAQLCLNIINISEESLPDLLAYQNLYMDYELRDPHFPPILFLLALLKCKDPIDFVKKLNLFLKESNITISYSAEAIVQKIKKFIVEEINSGKLLEILSSLKKKLESLEIVNEGDETLVFSIQCCLLCIEYLQQHHYLISEHASFLSAMSSHCLALLSPQKGIEFCQKRERRSTSVHALPAIPEETEEFTAASAAAAAAMETTSQSATPMFRRRLVRSAGFPMELSQTPVSSSSTPLRDVQSDSSHDKSKAPFR